MCIWCFLRHSPLLVWCPSPFGFISRFQQDNLNISLSHIYRDNGIIVTIPTKQSVIMKSAKKSTKKISGSKMFLLFCFPFRPCEIIFILSIIAYSRSANNITNENNQKKLAEIKRSLSISFQTLASYSQQYIVIFYKRTDGLDTKKKHTKRMPNDLCVTRYVLTNISYYGNRFPLFMMSRKESSNEATQKIV